MSYIRILANISVEQFTKWCFSCWFYNVFKTIRKKIKKGETLLTKNTKEKQISVIIMTTVDGEETVSPVKLKLEWKSFE